MNDTVTVELNIPMHGKDFVFTTDSLKELYPSPSTYFICSCGTLQRKTKDKRIDIPNFNGNIRLMYNNVEHFIAYFNDSKLVSFILK